MIKGYLKIAIVSPSSSSSSFSLKPVGTLSIKKIFNVDIKIQNG